jgi:hypothetical protein
VEAVTEVKTSDLRRKKIERLGEEGAEEKENRRETKGLGK